MLALGLATIAPAIAQGRPPAPAYPTSIQKYRELIPRLMAEQGIPGLAVAVADESHVLWAEGFGYTARDRGTPVRADTAFGVQSVSTALTAVAVMLVV